MNEDEAIALARAAARSTSNAEHSQHAYLQNIGDDWQPHLWVVLAVQHAYQRGCRDQAQTLFPLDEDVRHILGKPNFACGFIAERMRSVMGHTIRHKAEEEQAAVIYFCLGHYLKHGPLWAKYADAELNGDKA
jgi:hypothetical protein